MRTASTSSATPVATASPQVKRQWHHLYVLRARVLTSTKKAPRPGRLYGEGASDSDSDLEEPERQPTSKGTWTPGMGRHKAQALLLGRKAQKAGRFVSARRGEMDRLLRAVRDKEARGLPTGLLSDDEWEEAAEVDVAAAAAAARQTCHCRYCFARMDPATAACAACKKPAASASAPSPSSAQRTQKYAAMATTRPSWDERAAAARQASSSGRDRSSSSLGAASPSSPPGRASSARVPASLASRALLTSYKTPSVPASPARRTTPPPLLQHHDLALRRMLQSLRLSASVSGSAASPSTVSSSGSWAARPMSGASSSSAFGPGSPFPASLRTPGAWQGPEGGSDSPHNRRARSGQVTRKLRPFMSAVRDEDLERCSSPSRRARVKSKGMPWWALI